MGLFRAVPSVVFLCLLLGPAAPAATITAGGKVLDASGDPVAGARVSAIGSQTFPKFPEIAAECLTASDGTFSLEFEFPAGRNRTRFVATHPDYGLAWTDQWRLQYSGETVSRFMLRLAAPEVLSGQVVDPQGKGIAGALVAPRLSVRQEVPYETTHSFEACPEVISVRTSADGSFSLSGVPKGALVTLHVSALGFADAIEGHRWSRRRGIEGTIAAGSSDAVVKLAPGASLSGRAVMTAANAPVAGAAVSVVPVVDRALPRNEGWVTRRTSTKSVETDDSGAFRIEGLPTGAYGLQVFHPDGAAPVKKEIVLASGQHLGGQDFSLEKGVLVSGRFAMAETGAAVPDGRLRISGGASLHSSAEVELAKDGSFAFRQLPGTLHLLPTTSASGKVEQTQLEVEDGVDQTGLTLEVTPWHVYRGHVVDGEGKPVSGATVSLARNSGSEAVSGQDGSFAIPLVYREPRDHEMLMLLARDPSRPGWRGITGQGFQSEEDLQGEIVLRPTGRVAGRVVNAEGQPLKGAAVNLSALFMMENWGMSHGVGLVTTGSDGRFAADDVYSATSITLQASATGYGQAQQSELRIEPGEAFDAGEMTLEVADQVIEGQVINQDGEPVEGVEIHAYSQGTGSRNVSSGPDGRYRVERLVNEQIQLSAYQRSGDGYLHANAQVFAGETGVELFLTEQGNYRMNEEMQLALRLAGKPAKGLDVARWVNTDPVSFKTCLGHSIVLAFLDGNEEASRDYLPELERLAREYRGRDVEVWALYTPDTAAANLEGLDTREDPPFRIALDRPAEGGRYKGATSGLYGAKDFPAVYLVDEEGVVRYQDLALPRVEEKLEELVEGGE